MTKTPYDLLGVKPTATDKEIRIAYRKLAMQHHPDRNNHSPEAAKRFNEIQEAYECLRDPIRRRRYDLTGDARPLPEATENEVLDRLSVAMSVAIDKLEGITEYSSLLDAMKEVCQTARTQCLARLDELRKKKRGLEKSIPRIGVSSGPNVLEQIARQSLEVTLEMIRQVETELVRVAKALDIIHQHTYKVDGPHRDLVRFPWMGGTVMEMKIVRRGR